MMYDVKYVELVGRKALCLSRLFNPYRPKTKILFDLEIATLNGVEKDLAEYKKNPKLEKILAAASILKTKMESAKDILSGVDICYNCKKYVEAGLDAPDCSTQRIANHIKESCKDHEDANIIDKETQMRIAKEDLEHYDAFLKLIKEGVMDNYKEKLKIK